MVKIPPGNDSPHGNVLFDNLVTNINSASAILLQQLNAEGLMTAKLRMTVMDMMSRIIAWLCVFSTLLTGCYSSSLIDPANERDRVYSDRIDYVVTYDGTKYEFSSPPSIVNDTIIGDVKIKVPGGTMTKQVSVLISDVTRVGVSKFNATSTVLLVVAGAAAVGLILVGMLAKDMHDAIEELH